MKLPRVDIVATSIGRGEFIESYARLIERAGVEDAVRLIVVPDHKTRPELYEAAERASERGAEVVVPTLDEQRELVDRLGIPNLVPYNSDNRRNVGYLLAWMSDAEWVISIDDDNLPGDEDFLAKHAIVTEDASDHNVVTSSSGWFNPCELLTTEPESVRLYARGFPYGVRFGETEVTVRRERARVRINAGLWIGDPDVDAVTRLATRPRVSGMRNGSVVLDEGTWAPVNSQNTAIHRDVLPAYYFVRMGAPLLGHRIDRFGDIFSGYFAQACAKHLGDAVRFGDPTTDHVRNDHEGLDDLAKELPGILAIEELLDALRECPLEGSTYAEAYGSLSAVLDELAEDGCGSWSTEARGFLHETAYLMRRWLDVLKVAEP